MACVSRLAFLLTFLAAAQLLASQRPLIEKSACPCKDRNSTRIEVKTLPVRPGIAGHYLHATPLGDPWNQDIQQYSDPPECSWYLCWTTYSYTWDGLYFEEQYCECLMP